MKENEKNNTFFGFSCDVHNLFLERAAFLFLEIDRVLKCVLPTTTILNYIATHRQQSYVATAAVATTATMAMTNDYIWTSQQMVRVQKFRL